MERNMNTLVHDQSHVAGMKGLLFDMFGMRSGTLYKIFGVLYNVSIVVMKYFCWYDESLDELLLSCVTDRQLVKL